MKKTCIYIGRKLVIFLLSIFLLSLITFYIARLAPGIAVFGLSFISLFSGMLIARDRTSAFVRQRKN